MCQVRARGCDHEAFDRASEFVDPVLQSSEIRVDLACILEGERHAEPIATGGADRDRTLTEVARRAQVALPSQQVRSVVVRRRRLER